MKSEDPRGYGVGEDTKCFRDGSVEVRVSGLGGVEFLGLETLGGGR